MTTMTNVKSTRVCAGSERSGRSNDEYVQDDDGFFGDESDKYRVGRRSVGEEEDDLSGGGLSNGLVGLREPSKIAIAIVGRSAEGR